MDTPGRTAALEPLIRFLPLSPQVLQILLSLHEAPLHGYSIIQDVRERTRDEVRLTASTLYDALARLVDQALIEPSETPADETDSRRRYYRLTTLGREVAAAEARRLARLLDMTRALGIGD
jgi:DNA-binding PadR family transcriptional regulator